MANVGHFSPSVLCLITLAWIKLPALLAILQSQYSTALKQGMQQMHHKLLRQSNVLTCHCSFHVAQLDSKFANGYRYNLHPLSKPIGSTVEVQPYKPTIPSSYLAFNKNFLHACIIKMGADITRTSHTF